MVINSQTARFCYLDLDLCQHRAKLALAAAFVDATDSRYGFSSKDILALGGSELARIQDLIQTDHEWSTKNKFGTAIEIRPPEAGNRIVVRLNWEIAPLACENFATLCDNGSIPVGKTIAQTAPIGTSGKPLTYRDSVVHRIIPKFILQGGDFVFGNGSGGESVYNGKKFKDERAGLLEKHDRRGILSMGNSGKNSNSSQWFITFDAAPQCDGKHVVFGEVVSGWDVLDAIEQLSDESLPGGGGSNVEFTTCRVTDCGLWIASTVPWSIPGGGYWLDAPDSESYTGVSSVFVVQPRVAVVVPSEAVGDRFRKVLRPYCFVTIIFAPMDSVVDNDCEPNSSVVAKVDRLLMDFAIDIVLVSPSCAGGEIKSLQLPALWLNSADESTRLSVADVVLGTRPADALQVVHSNSWLRKSNWKLYCS